MHHEEPLARRAWQDASPIIEWIMWVSRGGCSQSERIIAQIKKQFNILVESL